MTNYTQLTIWAYEFMSNFHNAVHSVPPKMKRQAIMFAYAWIQDLDRRGLRSGQTSDIVEDYIQTRGWDDPETLEELSMNFDCCTDEEIIYLLDVHETVQEQMFWNEWKRDKTFIIEGTADKLLREEQEYWQHQQHLWNTFHGQQFRIETSEEYEIRTAKEAQKKWNERAVCRFRSPYMLYGLGMSWEDSEALLRNKYTQ